MGIFSLIVATVIEMKDPSQVFARISMYMVTVILGLAIHGFNIQIFFSFFFKFILAFVILPTLYVIITRKNVFKFAKNMFDALFIAIATASR